eukprot:COSAG01_NODE_21553_length_896_cov_5.491844_2_plen_88_part_00
MQGAPSPQYGDEEEEGVHTEPADADMSCDELAAAHASECCEGIPICDRGECEDEGEDDEFDEESILEEMHLEEEEGLEQENDDEQSE